MNACLLYSPLSPSLSSNVGHIIGYAKVTFMPSSATAAFDAYIHLPLVSCNDTLTLCDDTLTPCDDPLTPCDDSLTPCVPVQVKMTLLLSAVAVPINTVFGVTCAILIARNEFPGKLILTSMLDLPFSISPVVTGQPATLASRPYPFMLPCFFACWPPPSGSPW